MNSINIPDFEHASAGDGPDKVLYFGIAAEPWELFDEVNKLVYLKGLFDGAMCNGNKLFGTKLFSKVSIQKYIDALDVFYQDDKNAAVPVPLAIQLASLLLSGSGSLRMRWALSKARRTAANLQATRARAS